MKATDRTNFQVHANVNADGRDSALRVSITFYDENGFSTAHETYRRHVTTLQLDGTAWQAYSAVVELCKMMGEIATGQRVEHLELDTPLF